MKDILLDLLIDSNNDITKIITKYIKRKKKYIQNINLLYIQAMNYNQREKHRKGYIQGTCQFCYNLITISPHRKHKYVCKCNTLVYLYK